MHMEGCTSIRISRMVRDGKSDTRPGRYELPSDEHRDVRAPRATPLAFGNESLLWDGFPAAAGVLLRCVAGSGVVCVLCGCCSGYVV